MKYLSSINVIYSFCIYVHFPFRIFSLSFLLFLSFVFVIDIVVSCICVSSLMASHSLFDVRLYLRLCFYKIMFLSPSFTLHHSFSLNPISYFFSFLHFHFLNISLTFYPLFFSFYPPSLSRPSFILIFSVFLAHSVFFSHFLIPSLFLSLFHHAEVARTSVHVSTQACLPCRPFSRLMKFF